MPVTAPRRGPGPTAVNTATQEPAAELAGRARLRAVPRPSRRRWKLVAGVVIVLAAAAAAATVWVTDPFVRPKGARAASADPSSLATVTERSLASQTQVSATLGYAGNYSVFNYTQGHSTSLPTVGQIVSRGQPIYSVDGNQVTLLYGDTPAYRDFRPGMSDGADVKELEQNLLALGYANSSNLVANGHFDSFDATAIERWQKAMGLSQSGVLTLGRVVFMPEPIRITAVSATLGAPAQLGVPVLQATSMTREVIANLDATQQSDVKAGDQVTITLPGNRTTPGVVTSVGTVATAPPSGPGSGSNSASSGTPTVEVDVKPTDPAATGTLDQAPVTIAITTASVNNAIVVPVDALLAQASGVYAVEVVEAGSIHKLVPVSLGLFDDADGLVQVIGSGLSAGQQVVIPKI